MINRSIALFIIGLFLATAVQSQPTGSLFSSDSTMLIVPFRDNSGFSGKWRPSIDVPRFFAAYIRERFRIGVVNPLSVHDFAIANGLDSSRIDDRFHLRHYAEHFRTRYIVTGTIEEFTIERFMVSEVQLAGYEAFLARVRISFSLVDAAKFGNTGTPSTMYEGEAEGVVRDRSLGITLFGKRTDRTSEYFSLDELSFGSEEFNKTIIGEALFKCADDLGMKLERAVPSLVSKSVVLSSSVVIDTTRSDSVITVKRHLINGEIVIVDDDDVFINLGSLDRLTVGDILPVIKPGNEITDPNTGVPLGVQDEKIGEIQIIEIRAEHLSLGTIISGKGSIQPKQRVRKVIVR